MFAVFSSYTSCSGDEHDFIIAAFTTKEKAEDIFGKMKDFFPNERFYIGEYIPPKIDPTFEELLWETSDAKTNNEAETLLQHNESLPECGGSVDDFGWLSELQSP